MAWRGRGRGRGGGRGGFGGFGGFGFRRAKQEPFVLFPEDVVLPEHWYVKPDDPLITKKLALQRFYGASVYHIKGKDIKSMLDNQVAEIERYSDRNKSDGQINRDSLSDFVKLSSSYLPPELFEGTKMERQPKKKVRWDPDSDLQKLDKYEKLEGKGQGQEKKEEKEKEEVEDEHEGVVSEEEEEEESDDGDYNQNCDFDDDEDDLNMEEDDDGPAYDD
eukprot:TRINITY_DN3302_c1_g1_i2.p1 TRINITY_DN3302_c1_g1~~TRINITY_DN3302_c1_g1_i2.p1  ORF type:complete len:219 (-),score=70.89 TRINITY_DN3302_c1_g1_i2:602-1258(-)